MNKMTRGFYDEFLSEFKVHGFIKWNYGYITIISKYASNGKHTISYVKYTKTKGFEPDIWSFCKYTNYDIFSRCLGYKWNFLTEANAMLELL